MAMTPAERQRKRREKLKQEALTPLLVKGKDGEFDPRIRIASAVQLLAQNGDLSDETLAQIISCSKTIFGSENLVTQKYIEKIISNFLNREDLNE